MNDLPDRYTVRREDDQGAVTYRLPITPAEAQALANGQRSLFLTVRIDAPSLAVAIVPFEARRVTPADYLVRLVPLLVGPEAQPKGASP